MVKPKQIYLEFYWAIEDCDIAKMETLYASQPALHHSHFEGNPSKESWAEITVKVKQPASLKWLIDTGFDINAASMPGESTGLDRSILTLQTECFEILLAHGANPNIGRPLICALNQRIPVDQQRWFVTKLIQHGADVNKLHDLYGDASNSFTALDFVSNDQARALLIGFGAKSAKELKSPSASPVSGKTALTA